MANGLNKHHILEAIDKLRSRKSRPDAFRIVSYVSKKYEFPKNDIKEYLETLSKNGTVLKVEFKGSFSYRNAANHRNAAVKSISPTNNEETSLTHESISDLVAGALAQLIVEEPDYLDVGISKHELYEHLDTKHKKAITKTYFKEILQKEVKNGNLVKFENGNYCLGYPTGEQNSMSSSVSDVSQNSVDKEKEKSKSPIQSLRKYSSFSRHSSPSSSKHSSRSSSALSERHTTHVIKGTGKTFLKANKKPSKVIRREVEMDKSEVSPSRESSRRKRFQKIVFDPSDNQKPKRMKEKKQTVVVQQTRMRGSYKKQFKESGSDGNFFIAFSDECGWMVDSFAAFNLLLQRKKRNRMKSIKTYRYFMKIGFW
ncbi:hypothetical protein RUM43_014479 [Polyplax serrata]|uniref:SAMD1-like winged helix (WH) domain-containing protein n=1 Tax=Polyplax serrata TaxID=468196 RepID=A0AAN8P4Y9_POLSC